MHDGDRDGDFPDEGRGSRLISEPLEPVAEGFDANAMSRGEPGLPSGFRWRGEEFRIEACLRAWKVIRPESGSGQRYLRRHSYLLRMANGSRWEVYLLRQPSGPRNPKKRWFLFRIL